MTTATRAYACQDEERREELRGHPTLMGIDYLEVSEEQDELHVYLVPNTAADRVLSQKKFAARDIEISGGTRITNVRVKDVRYPGERGYPEDLDGAIVVEVEDDEVAANGVGDFSPYILGFVGPDDLLDDLDPLFSRVPFSFKVGCPTEFDCEPRRECPVDPLSEPELDYLAKDYASFRRLILDRLSVSMRGWEERSPADLQITLVELLAYVGDYLSYQQDAVATEAYLGTVGRRASARRHARLVDYFMHDGCNARAWVQVQLRENASPVTLLGPSEDGPGTRLVTRTNEPPSALSPDEVPAAVSAGAEVFETMHEVTLHAAHNELEFYTWGNRECCLPEGATSATLEGDQNALAAGDVLIFEEKRGPRTGEPEDADPNHRHAVRLTEVARSRDPLYREPFTEIEWHLEDALLFSLCVSATTDEEHESKYFEDVSVARGNVVLADHGRTIGEEPRESLGTVPDEDPVPRVREDGRPGEPDPVFPRFRPWLERGPLTQAAPYVEAGPAASAMRWDLRDVLPRVRLDDDKSLETWSPGRDLLGSGPADRQFVAEVESDGRAYVRFGDDTFGLRPARGTEFFARYRVGNGLRGNVGAGAISYAVTAEAGIGAVRNPMPARGGVEPETIEEVRQRAPSAFRVQERAVTPDDYAEVAGRHPEVQRAAATIRWTGSWYTVFLTVDRFGGREIDGDFEEELRVHLERYRMAGQDLEVDGPSYAPLEIEVSVCVLPEYFRSDVKAVLLEALGNRDLPDGRRGLFHPDNFTFGQPVYLSRLYEAAQAVEGVAWVEITKFGRQGAPDPQALQDGVLRMHRLEIPRLDNDLNFPENGVLGLVMEGGK